MRTEKKREVKQKFINHWIVLMVFTLSLFSIPYSPFSVLQSFARNPRIVVVGSTTMLPLSEHFATHYQKKRIAEVLVQGGGSSAGIKAVLNNIAQVGASSRALSSDEKKNLKTYSVARDAIAIVVHEKNPITNITMDQLRGVLSGRIKNWKELGAPFDKPIQLINDSAGAGTRAAIEELVMGKNREKHLKGTPITLMSVVTNSSSEMKLNITHSKYAIGYLPFSYLDSTVKPISLDGIPPTYAAAYKGDYPLFRYLYYVIKKNSSDIGLAYIYYVLSPEGQDIVVQEGFLPMKLITSVGELDRIRKANFRKRKIEID